MSIHAKLNLVESSPALAAALAIGLVLAFQINLHYKLLGGSFIEGLLASRLVRTNARMQPDARPGQVARPPTTY